jgi:hypothetical protein
VANNWLIWIVLAVALLFVVRVLLLAFARPSQPAEPDDYAEVPASLRPRPRPGAAAVALAEPEDGEFTLHSPFTRR